MKLLAIIRILINALVKPWQRIDISQLPKGRILDIGGGGEGVIAQVGRTNVITIDKNKSEIREALDKAPDSCWVVADGTQLPCKSESIETATAFFSCMYMPDEVKDDVFREIHRVLKHGSEFWLWDAPMASKNKVFGIRLLAYSGKNTVRAVYGVKAKNQSADTLCQSLNLAGLESDLISNHRYWFFIKVRRV